MSNQMKKRFTIMLLALAAGTAAQGQSVFRNFGVLTDPPPIDAETVENFGNIIIASGNSIPFDTQNTKTFINHPTGGMIDNGASGFRFDYLPGNSSVREFLDSFINSGQIITAGRIDVMADNLSVIDLGLLSTDRRGALNLVGNTVNLFNGSLRAGDASDRSNFTEGSSFSNASLYENPLNIREDAWGIRSNSAAGLRLSLPNLAFSPGFSPSHTVQLPSGIPASGSTTVSTNVDAFSPNFYLDSRFQTIPNAIRATVNMVFVETNVAGMADLNVGFQFTTNSNNYEVQSSLIEFGLTARDLITGAPYTRNLTLIDESSEVAGIGGNLAGHFLQENIVRNGRFRPRAHVLSRTDGDFFSFFFTPQPPQDYDSDIVFTTSAALQNGRYVTNLVDFEYSSSQFTINPFDFSDGGFGGVIEGNPGAVAKLQDLTNSPGQVTISADQLDLTLARIRAESLLTIKVQNITSSQDLVLDAPNISLELLSLGGTTVISNFFPASVSRLNGQMSVWSGVWLIDQLITNQAPATYDPFRNGFRNWVGSNTINYAYQMTIVDHNLSTNLPVTVQKLRVNSDELILVDPITINDEFFFLGTSLTFSPTNTNSVLNFTQNHPSINSNHFPNLLNLTNNAIINVPSQVNFGFDRAGPYSNIVNNGLIQSGSVLFKSDYFENTNSISALAGSIFVEAATNRLLGGTVAASQSISFVGDDLVVNNAVLSAQQLFFDIKQRLSDEDTTNQWAVTRGFKMLATPAKGDLLSTEIRSFVGTNLPAAHQWAGEDRGDHPAGYANNAALGRLVLDGATGSRFFFNGSGTGSALYVDTIQLNNNATNFESAISVSSNFKIYFANLVDTNNVPLPADKFTNAHNGRICWVSEATRSGPIVTIPLGIGQSTNMTTQAMRALLPASGDFDGDGIRNADDSTPLSGFTLNSVSTVAIADPPGATPMPHAKIVWQGIPNTTYIVEYRGSIADGGWSPLTVLISTSAGEMTAYDPLPESGQRFYRVRYSR